MNRPVTKTYTCSFAVSVEDSELFPEKLLLFFVFLLPAGMFDTMVIDIVMIG